MNRAIFRTLNRVFLFSLSFIILTPNAAEAIEPDLSVNSCGSFSFEAPAIINTQQIHSSVTVADFNRDGIPDAVAAIPDLDFVSVFLGNNDGTLQAEQNFAAGDSPQGIAAGDFNRDGELDLAVTSQFDQKVNILHGDGTGNFAAPVSYSTPGTTTKVATTDFNNDGWLDLAIGSTSLRILFGSSSGFAPGPNYTTPLAVTNVSTADFNGDNFADIAVTFAGESFDGGVRVYLNNQNGEFTSALTVNDPTRFRAVQTKDFNNDGKIDVVATGIPSASGGSAKLAVLLGNGNGTFTTLPLVNDGGSFGGMTSGDFNNDGKLDIVGSYGGISLGVGDGTFIASGGLYPIVFPNDVAAADFNGDGNLDLIQANSWRSRLYIYHGKGNGKFPVPNSFPYSFTSTGYDSVAADFNNDGRKDIASIQGNSNVILALQDSGGNFVYSGVIHSSGSSPVSNSLTIVSADFNGDTNADLAFTHVLFNQLIILLGNGAGQFSTFIISNLNGTFRTPEVIRTGNFNNDNFIDLAILNRDASNYTIFLGNGNGMFSIQLDQRSVPFSNSTNSMVVTDVNVDGKDDLIIGRNTNNLYIFKGNGDGTFQPGEIVLLPRQISSITADDFNNDGRPDFAVVSSGSPTSYFVKVLNNANGTFSAVSFNVENITNGAVVADYDRDGHKDVIVGGFGFPQNTASFFGGDGAGNFTPAQPFENFGGKPFSTADFNNDGLADYGAIGAVYYNNAIVGPCLTIADANVTETDTGTANAEFTVTLSAASSETVTVDYKLVGRNAVAVADFDNVFGPVTFPPGTLSQTIQIPVRGDLLDEPDEVFNVQLSNAVNASIKDAQAKGTILDNDEPPQVSINDVSMTEGSGGASQIVFNVSLSAPSGRQTKIGFATQNGTASAPGDFTAISGTLPIEQGLTSKQIIVSLNPDTLVETDENFQVVLSNPAFLNIADGEALGTIVNDDFGGNVQFADAVFSVTENAGTATITITRQNGNASGITVQYATSDGTAAAGSDYTAVSGSVVFDANETTKTFTIPIIDDTLNEADTETVNISFAGVSGGATIGSPSVAVLNIQDNEIQRNNVADFDGDGKTDISIYRPTAGEWWYLRSSDNQNRAFQFGNSSDKITPGDFTGDGKTDVAIWRNSTGEWFILRSEDSSYYSFPFGTAGDIPAVGDFDSDGNADAAVFRPSDSTWYILRSSGGVTIQQFGQNGDVPVVSDYDGDGKADIAIYRPSAGEWWIQRSAGGVIAYTFGTSTDKPVQGDYTGDGKSDVAIYRPISGEWFILRSENSSYYSFPFGTSGDIPAPGDFDGDGKTDAAVFRPGDTNWYVNQSTGGFLIRQFGAGGDLPVPSSFIP